MHPLNYQQLDHLGNPSSAFTRAGAISGICVLIATLFGAMSAIACRIAAYDQFGPWGIAALLFLFACWGAGALGAVLGIAGIFGSRRSLAVWTTVASTVVPAIFTALAYAISAAYPMGGGPGGF